MLPAWYALGEALLASVEVHQPRGRRPIAVVGVGHLAGAVHYAAHHGDSRCLRCEKRPITSEYLEDSSVAAGHATMSAP